MGKHPSIAARFAREKQKERTAGPNLMAREGDAADVDACRSLCESSDLRCPDDYWCALAEMWRELLADGTMQLSLVEDRARRLGPRIVSFGATVFVEDGFCNEAQSTLPPYLGSQLMQRYLARALPVLSQAQSARANADGGLNVLLCFGGLYRDGMSSEQLLAVRLKQTEMFYFALRGYRLKQFMADTIGEDSLQWMLDAGLRLRRDYSNYFRKKRLTTPRSSQRPWLVGLTKDEAFEHPGSQASGLFIYTPPRFHFRPSEQRVLRQALVGETVEEEARSLLVSRWTVKKRWQAIYQRVSVHDEELLPPPIMESPHAASRGTERRRRLLQYLRQHPEELRGFSRWEQSTANG